ncbi:Phage Tail Collar Domain protein [compost metagenome]
MVGMVGMFAMATPPAGWMRANGAAVSRTVYAALFARIGTIYGAGDGVSTFNLPNARGRFPRFFDDGRGIDPGRVLGSDQGDEIRSHNHAASSAANGGHTHSAWTDAQGEHTHQVKEGAVGTDGSGEWLTSGDDMTRDINNYSTTTAAGSHAHNVGVGAVGDHTHPITVSLYGGNETRPQNIAFLACVKY